MFQKRVDQVIEKMKTDGLKQILVSEPCSIYYLTGVDVGPGERLFALYLNDEGRKVLFLNTLFTVEQKDCEEIWFSDTDDSISMLASVIDSKETLGIDKEWTARFLIPLMEKCEGLKVVLGSKYVDDTRAIKDEKEIECMIENSQINDVVMERTRDFIKEGMTEKQVETFILEQYKLLGCQDVSFSPICSFGANGADPHHMPDDSVLKAGDSIVIDIGGRKDRYCSDMTRTYFCKEASDEYKKIHDIVRVAYTRANATSDKNDLSQYFHIIGSVEQQKGLCEVEPGKYEYTIYTSCCDLRNGIYYYTTYNNHQISGVNMFNENLDSEALISYPMIEEEMIHMQN